MSDGSQGSVASKESLAPRPPSEPRVGPAPPKRHSLAVPEDQSPTQGRRRSGATVRRASAPSDGGAFCGSMAYVKFTGRKRATLRPRAASAPADVSKAQAWMLWQFFHHLRLGR